MDGRDCQESNFDEVDLRQEPSDTLRPHSTSKIHDFFNSAFRRTFRLKKRRHHTTSDIETELMKSNISAPANCSKVVISEKDFELSRHPIQCCPFEINGYGSFILMDEFTVRKPKKMTIMVFLYEKIIILTKKQPNEDSYYYIGSIKMDQLGLIPVQKKTKNVLELKDHVNSVKFHRDIIFKLEAPSEYIQMEWRKAIEKCLWSQLLKAREKSQPQT